MVVGGCRLTPVTVLGMDLWRWEYASCVADFGVGEDWATLYDIESKRPGRGDATHLLTEAKRWYEGEGKRVSGTVALNRKMKNLYLKLGIQENDDDGEL